MSMKFQTSTVVIIAAVVGAGAFAAGRGTSGSLSSDAATHDPHESVGSGNVTALPLPASHDLPAGHPPISPGQGGVLEAAESNAGPKEESTLSWKVPKRWQSIPSTSTMRLATYRIPHAPGDGEDPEVTVVQAGGSAEANIERWIGQFGEHAKQTVKRTTKTIKSLEVTIVEIEGTYAGGMSKDAREEPGWALLGAIVATPGLPHFFKMTGPARSVKASRAELDELIASFTTR